MYAADETKTFVNDATITYPKGGLTETAARSIQCGTNSARVVVHGVFILRRHTR